MQKWECGISSHVFPCGSGPAKLQISAIIFLPEAELQITVYSLCGSGTAELQVTEYSVCWSGTSSHRIFCVRKPNWGALSHRIFHVRKLNCGTSNHSTSIFLVRKWTLNTEYSVCGSGTAEVQVTEYSVCGIALIPYARARTALERRAAPRSKPSWRCCSLLCHLGDGPYWDFLVGSVIIKHDRISKRVTRVRT